MRRAMSYVAPWAVVTALAVTLSWLGVRDVVRTAVSDRSAPVPVTGPVTHASPTVRPVTGASPSREPQSAEATRSARPPARPSARPSPRPPAAVPSVDLGDVRSYVTRGGRAALALAPGRVVLVSATPAPGFETRVSEAEGWLRLDFLGGTGTSSVIATWYRQKPVVRTYEY
ncbi:hypothetical protein ACIBF1_36825 [Spirillospora sp. NPDC050679]